MAKTPSWRRLDGPFSWVVCISSSLCLLTLAGVSLTAGIYNVMFLEAFNEGKGFTALITSINYGSINVGGEYL